jgi:uncharacterized protein (DUF1697 family)
VRHVVLLTGINLGRNRRIAMADLRALLSDLGYREPKTLLQSGNAVVESDEEPAQVADRVARGIADRFGFDVPVVVRTAAELAEVVAANPLPEGAKDPRTFQVTFLEKAPDPGALDDLDADTFLPERFALRGRELYTWTPGGFRDSALLKALGRARPQLKGTARNWNTVTKLHDLDG